MLRQKWLIASFALAFILTFQHPARCGLVFDFADLEAEAYAAAAGLQDSAFQSPTGVPFNATSEVIFGETRNTTVYNFVENGSRTDLVFTFDHVRGPSPGSFVFNWQYVEFTAPTAMRYEVSGFYGMTGDQQINLDVGITDITDRPFVGLFQNIQTSYDTPNQTFTVGQTEGDIVNFLHGSPTGTLIGGRSYVFFAQMSIEDDFLVGSPATAQGEIRLSLGHAVPEPTSLALLGAGSLGLIGYGFRLRKTKQAA